MAAQQIAPAGLQAYIDKVAPGYNLDPAAVLAVAEQEGASGAIGDNGTSFGPFQLHYGGAFPVSAPHGSAAASQSWAWSPAGIDYALQQIADHAAGLRGDPAIIAIVRDFERPTDPGSEIANAEAVYGNYSSNGAPSGTSSTPTATGQPVSLSLGSPVGTTEALAIRAGLFIVGAALLVVALILIAKAATSRNVAVAGLGFVAGREEAKKKTRVNEARTRRASAPARKRTVTKHYLEEAPRKPKVSDPATNEIPF